MATVDPTNVLFKIAHPDLYARNPFNLLNLPIDATAKDIRRRREDIDAAFEAGTEEDEFKYVLPLDNQRKPPTQDAVHEAFDALNDPEMRIAYSLFWFWPHPSTSNSNINNQQLAHWIKKFCERQLPAEEFRSAQQSSLQYHNLAVLCHLYVLTNEQLETSGGKHVDSNGVNALWTFAIRYWNSAFADADFWHLVSEMVSSLNDPRLDYHFARSLRDQFAFAFDQINVELAIAFAKAGRESDAKRQVGYMKLSQPEADDVEGTFDDAFAGLQKQVEAIVNAARDEANSNPKSGLAKVDEILERTKEPVQISRIIFGMGEPIRESVITTIFSGIRSCMIDYGNDTKDWEGCLRRIDALRALAETDGQRDIVADDERILKRNKKAKDEVDLCWFCKINKKSRSAEIVVPMNGILIKEGKPWFHTVDITIPRCDECKSKTAIRDFLLKNTWILVVFLLPVIMSISYSISGENNPIIAVVENASSLWGYFINGFASGTVVFVGILVFISFLTKFTVFPNPNFLSKWLYRWFGPNYQDYPPYKALKEKGFKEGRKP